MKVISKKKKQVLLEDNRGYQFYITRELYDSEETETFLENSIPLSLDFSSTLQSIIEEKAGEIEEQLYRRGIHSLVDILNNRKTVNDVLKKYISAGSIVKNIKGD